ncbi:MAG: SDR family NAD(P)-dependent oxidoreductase [bacterium]
MQLKDKTALITGAARGIGQVTAIELARAGAHIMGVDLCLKDLEETENLITELGRRFHGFECDVSDEAAARALIAEAEKTNGGFDILINNAGVLPSGPFLEQDFSVWRRTIDINLTAVMVLTHAALPRFIARNSGHIVNMSSIAGKFGTEGVVAYAASKHGVVGFSSALREELRDTNIGVSWLCPSLVETRLAKDVSYTLLTPMIKPKKVARAVRKAIETNAAEIFVPRRVRFVVSILPSLLPKVARWILKQSQASQGWLAAHKELQA